MMKKITLLIALMTMHLGYSQTLPFDFSSTNQLMTADGGSVVTIEDDNGNDVLQIVGATAARLSRAEGMEAHARTGDIRLKKYGHNN